MASARGDSGTSKGVTNTSNDVPVLEDDREPRDSVSQTAPYEDIVAVLKKGVVAHSFQRDMEWLANLALAYMRDTPDMDCTVVLHDTHLRSAFVRAVKHALEGMELNHKVTRFNKDCVELDSGARCTVVNARVDSCRGLGAAGVTFVLGNGMPLEFFRNVVCPILSCGAAVYWIVRLKDEAYERRVAELKSDNTGCDVLETVKMMDLGDKSFLEMLMERKAHLANEDWLTL